MTTKSGKRAITDIDGGRIANVDVAGWLVTDDSIHDKIHEGYGFVASRIFEDVADETSVNMIFENGSLEKSAHIRIFGAHGGDSFARVYTGCTHTNGTVIASKNLNGESDTTSECSISYNGDNGASGDLMFEEFLPGASQDFIIGGMGDGEYIVIPGQAIMVEMTNKAGSSKTQGITILWYEANAVIT